MSSRSSASGVEADSLDEDEESESSIVKNRPNTTKTATRKISRSSVSSLEDDYGVTRKDG